MPNINIDRTERWPYYFVSDAGTGVGVPVKDGEYDELLELATASTSLQARLARLWSRVHDDQERLFKDES